MREGDVVIYSGIAGTVIQVVQDTVEILTKTGYILRASRKEVYEFQEGLELKEEDKEHVINQLESKARTSRRTRPY